MRSPRLRVEVDAFCHDCEPRFACAKQFPCATFHTVPPRIRVEHVVLRASPRPNYVGVPKVRRRDSGDREMSPRARGARRARRARPRLTACDTRHPAVPGRRQPGRGRRRTRPRSFGGSRRARRRAGRREVERGIATSLALNVNVGASSFETPTQPRETVDLPLRLQTRVSLKAV